MVATKASRSPIMEFVFGRSQANKNPLVRLFNGAFLVCGYLLFMVVPWYAIWALSRPPWIADAPPGAAQGADEDLSTSAGRRRQASTVDDEEHTDFRRIANSGRSFSQRDAMVAKLRQLSDELDDGDGF